MLPGGRTPGGKPPTGQTHTLLCEAHGPGLQSAVIGPAGENGVAYANVVCSGSCRGAASRIGWRRCPGFEALNTMGSMIDNPDLVSISNGNAQRDEMGMDTTSFGVILAFAAECVEKGIVTPEELGGRVDFP